MERLNELFYAHMMEYHADITNYVGRELTISCECLLVLQCLMKNSMKKLYTMGCH